jgi:hypothetical protein
MITFLPLSLEMNCGPDCFGAVDVVGLDSSVMISLQNDFIADHFLPFSEGYSFSKPIKLSFIKT